MQLDTLKINHFHMFTCDTNYFLKKNHSCSTDAFWSLFVSMKNNSKFFFILLEETIRPLLDTDINIRQTLSFVFEIQPFM